MHILNRWCISRQIHKVENEAPWLPERTPYSLQTGISTTILARSQQPYVTYKLFSEDSLNDTLILCIIATR